MLAPAPQLGEYLGHLEQLHGKSSIELRRELADFCLHAVKPIFDCMRIDVSARAPAGGKEQDRHESQPHDEIIASAN